MLGWGEMAKLPYCFAETHYTCFPGTPPADDGSPTAQLANLPALNTPSPAGVMASGAYALGASAEGTPAIVSAATPGSGRRKPLAHLLEQQQETARLQQQLEQAEAELAELRWAWDQPGRRVPGSRTSHGSMPGSRLFRQQKFCMLLAKLVVFYPVLQGGQGSIGCHGNRPA